VLVVFGGVWWYISRRWNLAFKHVWGTQNGWFIMENQSINGWYGGTPISGNLHMVF
jgi:hypothetical protein